MLSQNEYKSEPEWLSDAEGRFYKINIGTNNAREETQETKINSEDVITRWIYVIEDDTFDDGVMAMDVTDRVERDMKGENHKYRL